MKFGLMTMEKSCRAFPDVLPLGLQNRVEARFHQDPVQRSEFVLIPDAGYRRLPPGADRFEAQQRHVVLEREAALPRGVEDLDDPALEYRCRKVVVVHLEHRFAELQEERYPFRPFLRVRRGE